MDARTSERNTGRSAAASAGLRDFAGVARDLERWARDLRHHAAILEQQRNYLENAEVEYHKALEAIGQTTPRLTDGSISLLQSIQTSKSGEASSDLSDLFNRAKRDCEEHEAAVSLMTANLVRLESAWRQYAQGVAEGQRLRANSGDE